MMISNVYDFDGTIYDGDSTIRFYVFCVRRFPHCLIKLPKALIYAIKYKLKICDKTQFKECFYRFLEHIPKIHEQVEKFWDIEVSNIKGWYLKQQEENDIVITASPEFLVEAGCNRVGIKFVIGSKVNHFTGKTDGRNCCGEEKVKRLICEMDDVIIQNFYSDTVSDTPLANLAQRSYLVDGDRIRLWDSKCGVKKG